MFLGLKPTTPCIEYAGTSRDEFGYGIIWKTKGKIRAHRAAWEKANGSIPPGMCVLHRCDNPPCINPEHLFIGTRADNNTDRKLKGREPKRYGSYHPQVTITEQTAVRIKKLRGVMTQQSIADALGLTQAYVGKVMNGVAWKHVTAQTRYTF